LIVPGVIILILTAAFVVLGVYNILS
jgi:hypothetical protein